MAASKSIRTPARFVLSESSCGDDPFVLFRDWHQLAVDEMGDDANAMALATSTLSGTPSARMVLLRGQESGFVFFTNYRSRKGQELEANPQASLVFYWSPFDRQVRIEGSVTKVSPKDSDAYFSSRPTLSRLSAIASPQSRVVESRSELVQRVKELERTYGDEVPIRPEHWGGFRLVPHRIEFWQGRAGRLHDRILFERIEQGEWRRSRLAP